MTNAEQHLWYQLRRKQVCGFRFRRQHPFERFVLDFYCLEVKLAIELDGGQHNEPDIKAHDSERSEFLACHGIQVLRFWNNEVFTNIDAVLQHIYDVLVERAGQQHAPPP